MTTFDLGISLSTGRRLFVPLVSLIEKHSGYASDESAFGAALTCHQSGRKRSGGSSRIGVGIICMNTHSPRLCRLGCEVKISNCPAPALRQPPAVRVERLRQNSKHDPCFKKCWKSIRNEWMRLKDIRYYSLVTLLVLANAAFYTVFIMLGLREVFPSIEENFEVISAAMYIFLVVVGVAWGIPRLRKFFG